MNIKKLMTGVAAIAMVGAFSSVSAAGAQNYKQGYKTYKSSANPSSSSARYNASARIKRGNMNESIRESVVIQSGTHMGSMRSSAPLSGFYIGAMGNFSMNNVYYPETNDTADFTISPFGITGLAGYGFDIDPTSKFVFGVEGGIDLPFFSTTHEENQNLFNIDSDTDPKTKRDSTAKTETVTFSSYTIKATVERGLGFFGHGLVGYKMGTGKAMLYGVAGFGMDKFAIAGQATLDRTTAVVKTYQTNQFKTVTNTSDPQVTEIQKSLQKTASFSDSKFVGSFRLGGGVAFKISDSLAIRAEYVHAFKAKQKFSLENPTDNKSAELTLGLNEHIMRAGIVFSLGGL